MQRNFFLNFSSSLICILILTSLFGSIAIFGQAAQPNLVLYLPLDEGSGTTANDESGNGNVGVITGATWIAGISGKALEFDGLDDILVVNNTDILNSVNRVTIACWVKIKVPSQLRYFVMSPGFGLYQNGNETGIAISVSATNSVGFPIMVEEWIQITGTFDGVDIKFYVDGVLRDTQNWPGTMTTGTRLFIIGFFNDEYWEGAIDEVCVWNRILTAEEVESHYAKTNCATIPLSPVFLALLTLAGVIIFYKKRK